MLRKAFSPFFLTKLLWQTKIFQGTSHNVKSLKSKVLCGRFSDTVCLKHQQKCLDFRLHKMVWNPNCLETECVKSTLLRISDTYCVQCVTKNFKRASKVQCFKVLKLTMRHLAFVSFLHRSNEENIKIVKDISNTEQVFRLVLRILNA